jgi:hypothetical protein
VRVVLKPVAKVLCILILVLVVGTVSQTSSKLFPPLQEIPASFFGMHIHHMVSPNGTDPLTLWPNTRVPEWRLWDARVTWPDLEPNRGQWRFDNLDKSLALAEAHHAEVLMTLGLTPRWASARPEEPSGYQPGFAAEPKDLEDWRTFVRTFATRYKGRVRNYEIWNEPNLKEFWSGSTDQMVVLTREASQIIHSIDPHAVVVSPPATGGYGVKWLLEFLSKGGGQYVDVIGYHFYVGDQPPEAMVSVIQAVKQTMVNNGVGGKPLWDTEAGWFKPNPFPSDELGAAYLARAYILNWAAGVQRFYWYAWDNHLMTIETTEEDDETLRPAGRTFGIIQKWLMDARMDWCDEDSDHTWTCQLNRKGALQWIVWNPDGTKPLALTPSWKIESVTSLLQDPHPLTGTSLDVSPVPDLLTGANYQNDLHPDQ